MKLKTVDIGPVSDPWAFDREQERAAALVSGRWAERAQAQCG